MQPPNQMNFEQHTEVTESVSGRVAITVPALLFLEGEDEADGCWDANRSTILRFLSAFTTTMWARSWVIPI